jgi:4'-phosphopantetheinyl transferase EntD
MRSRGRDAAAVPSAGGIVSALPDFDSVELEEFPGVFLGRAPIAELDSERVPGWSRLHEAERAWAEERSARRLREFVAGRCALREALRAAGWGADAPLLPGEQGRPEIPSGFTGSITHKDGLALAVAARRDGEGDATLGLDSEVLGSRDRSSIAARVLREQELLRWQAGGARWGALLERFSMKESIYKALHPWVARFIGFEEAELLPGGGIALHLAQGEGPFALRGQVLWDGPRVLTVVEARRLLPAQ